MINTIKTLILFLGFFFGSCKKEDPIPLQENHVHTQQEINTMARLATENLTMGNPSGAGTTNLNNYLLSKFTWTGAYNASRGTCTWVSWHLDPTWKGTAARCNCFASDATLPTGVYRVPNTAYSSSGFDRGHNCPSEDRDFSSTDNRETFLMTNMIPQSPNNNQRTWNNMETYIRKFMYLGNECYIIMGSYGTGGTGSSGTRTTLDNGRVTVPAFVWKVVLFIPQGTNDISRVTTTSRIIAVITPNNQTVNSSWGVYRTTVDAIESATGLDLFSNLPDSIESVLESTVDTGPTL